MSETICKSTSKGPFTTYYKAHTLTNRQTHNYLTLADYNTTTLLGANGCGGGGDVRKVSTFKNYDHILAINELRMN